MVTKGVELVHDNPDLHSLGLSFQYLLNLGETRKAIMGIRKAAFVRGEGVVSPPLWLGPFYHIFVSEMNQF